MVTVMRKTKMQELADVLRYARSHTRHQQRAVADFVGCSMKEYASWEAGESAPDMKQWGRLCKMLRTISGYRSLWTQARAEHEAKQQEARVQKAPLSTPLGDKLAAVLAAGDTITSFIDPPAAAVEPEPAAAPEPKPAATPAPVVAPVVAAAPESESELDARGLPRGWRTPERMREREAFARELFQQDPSLSPKDVAERQPAKPEPAKPKPAGSRTEDNIAAATELLLDAIPNLASFTLTVNDQGQATVAFKTREVKVVETAGTVTLTRKAP